MGDIIAHAAGDCSSRVEKSTGPQLETESPVSRSNTGESPEGQRASGSQRPKSGFLQDWPLDFRKYSDYHIERMFDWAK
jgi:hypothetical protein